MVRRPPISTRTYTLLPDTTLVRSFIKALSFGVDFQRDVGSNARFDMIFEHKLAETGETPTGKLLYAGLDRGNKKLQMLRWTLGGREQFFDAGGEAAQKETGRASCRDRVWQNVARPGVDVAFK